MCQPQSLPLAFLPGAVCFVYFRFAPFVPVRRSDVRLKERRQKGANRLDARSRSNDDGLGGGRAFHWEKYSLRGELSSLG